MIKVKFPYIVQIKFYDQDRDNFSRNLLTAGIRIYLRPKRVRIKYIRISKEMLSLHMMQLGDYIKCFGENKNENWLNRITRSSRLKTKIP